MYSHFTLGPSCSVLFSTHHAHILWVVLWHWIWGAGAGGWCRRGHHQMWDQIPGYPCWGYRDRWVHKIIPVPVSVLTKICMPQLRWVTIVQKVLTKIWSCHYCSDCLDKDVHAAAELSHYCQCSEGLDKDLHTDPSHSCSAMVLTKMCMLEFFW